MIYVRDVGGTIIACKDYKINTKKTCKILVVLLMSCSKVFFPQHICSFILYTNIELNNMQCTNRVF